MFLSKIKSLSLVKRPVLGVDIGTTAIKIAEVVPGNRDKKPVLKNYGILTTYKHLERPNSAIQTSALKIAEKETAAMLKDLVGAAKFSTTEAIASISAFSVFMNLLEMPPMPEADLEKAMSFQIRQHVPMPLNEVNVEWSRVGEREAADGIKQQILLIAVPLETITHYKNIFAQAGLSLQFLEAENISVARAFIGSVKAPTLIADLGGRSTNITIIEDGFIKLSATIDYGGASLTSAIANGLGIDPRRAEELKRSRGLQAGAGVEELSTLPLPHLDVIIEEIKRQKNIFVKNQGNEVEKIIFCGGGANLLGLENYLQHQFGATAVTIGNALENFNYLSEINVLVKQLGAELAVAIGLALKS